MDVLTTGNHVWDKAEVISYISQEKRLIRPANYSATHLEKDLMFLKPLRAQKILVLNVMGRLFMEHVDNPFRSFRKSCSIIT